MDVFFFFSEFPTYLWPSMTRLRCLFFEPKCTVFVYHLYKDATKLQSFQRLTSGTGVSLSAIVFYQSGLIHMERKPNAYFYHHI